MKMLEYILNPEKNRNGELVTFWNCGEDIDDVYNSFKLYFEHFSHEKFEVPDDEPVCGKERIRIHHYIQSFAPGEVSPEEAHEIGVAWARGAFGFTSKYVVSTHTDGKCIHNHIALCPYRQDGKIWQANKKSLQRCRDLSDSHCKSHGLSVIKDAPKRTSVSQGEYYAQKRGTSWKERIRKRIDMLIKDPRVNSIEDMIGILEDEGCTITFKKYLTIRIPKMKRAVRSYKLGEGYEVDILKFRIAHRDTEMSMNEVYRYVGIQRELAQIVREIEHIKFRKTSNYKKATYADLVKTSELLCYISNNNIHSEQDFKDTVQKTRRTFEDISETVDPIDKEIKLCDDILANADRYFTLKKQYYKTIEEIHELESLKYIEDNGVKVKGDLFDIGWKRSGLIQKREKYADKYDRAKQEMEDAEKQEKYYREIMYDKFSEMVKLIRQKEEDERLMQEYDRKMYQASRRKQQRDTWSHGGR